MADVVWTPIAESDLDEILFYISYVDRKPATGERIYYEIRDTIAEHVANELPGHRHPDAPEGWLYLKHKRWLIFYQTIEDGIEVMMRSAICRDNFRATFDHFASTELTKSSRNCATWSTVISPSWSQTR